MKDEPGVRALKMATPSSSVQTLRNLFNDKDAKCKPPVSLKKPDSRNDVRIPRPSIAPKPSNNNLSTSARVQQESPVNSTPREPHGPAAQDSTNLPRPGDDASRKAFFEWNRAVVEQQVQLGLQRVGKTPGGKGPTSEKQPSSAVIHRISPMIKTPAIEDEDSASKQPSCEASSLPEEEDYVVPISFPKPQPSSGQKASITPPQQSEEASSHVPSHLSKSPVSLPKQKQKIPEPPQCVPSQLVRHPVVPGWRRRELPPATSSCPPKPARSAAMCLPSTSSPQGPTPTTAAQADGPPLPGRSPPPAPPSRPPPLRPAVPKPPRMLPALPITPANEPHEDEAASEDSRQPQSPIPEYTEDEETGGGETVYDDTAVLDNAPAPLPPARSPPAPPLPTEDGQYQDTLEELYEVMPTDDLPPPLPPPPLMGRESLSRKDKREYDRLCKALGLPGGWEQQQPLDVGRARANSTGYGPKGLNLSLRQGEPVYVLRMEHNPPGKWLVRNNQGEVGYADLANIEVMTAQRGPCANSRNQGGGFVKNECDEEEGIYEETT